jgi:hypothetical protein
MNVAKLLMASAVIFVTAAASPLPQVVRDRFGKILKDPLSAQFQLVRQPAGKICGRYNAKNSYGGYTGFEPFVFVTGERALYTVGTVVHANGSVESVDSIISRTRQHRGSSEDLEQTGRASEELMNRVEAAFEGCE